MYKLLNDEECEYTPDDFLKDIIKLNDDSNIIKLFDKINNLDSLKKLIYNIDVNTFEQQKEQTQDADEDAEQTRIRNRAVDTPNHFGFSKQLIIKFDYKKYDFIILESKFFENTIEINEHIRCLPNILSHASHCNFHENESNFLFVLFEKYNIILIIPSYLIIYFYDKYHVFDKKLNKQNFISGDYDIDFFKNLNFFKILNTKEITNIDEYSKTYEAFILFIMITLNSDEQLYGSHYDLIKKLNHNINKTFIEKFESEIRRFFDIRYSKKYLKYKKKYLSLKNQKPQSSNLLMFLG
jgi:hypothetical protein